MKTTLIDLFTSKKFLAALAAIIVYLAGRFGFAVDPATLDRVFAALLVYVGAQGVADVGKSAAALHVVAANQSTVYAQEALRRVAGTLSVLALVVLGLGASASLTACGAGQVAADTGERIIDCAKLDVDQLATVSSQLAASVTAYVVAGTPIDWDAIERSAEVAGLAIGGCALGPLVASRGPANSLAVGPPQNDSARAWTAFARLKSAAGGATFRTRTGDL